MSTQILQVQAYAGRDNHTVRCVEVGATDNGELGSWADKVVLSINTKNTMTGQTLASISVTANRDEMVSALEDAVRYLSARIEEGVQAPQSD